MPTLPPQKAPIVRADELQAPLACLLRPLVRLLIKAGITFPALSDLLRELYVNVAENDFALSDKEQTDSRVSLLTGIHRKEVRRLRGAGAPVSTVPTSITQSSQIIARWLGSAELADPTGKPLPLPRTTSSSADPSFDALVESVTRDVRPRAVLDEFVAQGLVSIDDDGLIRLSETAFVPRDDSVALAYYFGRNMHDHMAAATSNLILGPRFMERAVHYDGLTAEQAAHLEAMSRKAAIAALTDINRQALAVVDEPTVAVGSHRWTLGVYIYQEDIGNLDNGTPTDSHQRSDK